MKQYLELLEDVMRHGERTNDRTGTGTYSVFGRQLRFNLEDGFPLVTTKKVFWRGIVEELLWMLCGDTNVRRLQEKGVRIWNEWIDVDGDLGPIYGYQWRKTYRINTSECEIVKRKRFVDTYIEEKPDIIPVNYEYIEGCLGQSLMSNLGYEFKVIGCELVEVNGKRRVMYTIQFTNTRHVKKVRKDAAIKGAVKDDFEPSVYGVGYVGNIDVNVKKTELYKRAYKIWNSMLQRCYDKSFHEYGNYGGIGVTVCKRWHNFTNFFYDIKSLYGYYDWKKSRKYELDKDYFGYDVYCPEGCLFIEKSINTKLCRARALEYKGKLYIDSKDLCDENPQLNQKYLNKVLSNGNGKGVYSDVKVVELESDEYVRYKFEHIDQLAEVINSIKNNPTSRRLIVTAWNPSDIDNMALPPCHCFFQFHVRGGKYLDLQLYQRSADLFLGVPFNIASYSLLLMMVAQECGLIPGEFVHTFGDAHIYLNHIEQVQRQLDRIPLPLPNVTIDNATWDGKRLGIFDLTADNIHLLDYKHYPPISAPVSV